MIIILSLLNTWKYCSGAVSNYSLSPFLITDWCVFFFSLLQAKVKSLKGELETVSQSKAMLEKELQEVINLTSTELEEYQEKVMELEDEVRENLLVNYFS